MTRPVHFQIEILYDCAFQPLCENQRGEDAFADLALAKARGEQ